MATKVRVTAGDQQVLTEPSVKKQFHQPLLVTVEQGTQHLLIELVHARRGRVLGKLDLDIYQDIIKGKIFNSKRIFAMKETSKEVVDVRISLMFKDHTRKGDEEQGVLVNDLVQNHLNDETKIMMKAHLASCQQELVEEDVSEEVSQLTPHVQKMRVIAKGCCGPVKVVRGWGSKSEMYLGVQGPPEKAKFKLALWDCEQDFLKAREPQKEIQLLRVRGVALHPQTDQTFVISHFLTPERKEDLLMFSMDRNRQVWVESLSLLVRMVHEMREEKKTTTKKKNKAG